MPAWNQTPQTFPHAVSEGFVQYGIEEPTLDFASYIDPTKYALTYDPNTSLYSFTVTAAHTCDFINACFKVSEFANFNPLSPRAFFRAQQTPGAYIVAPARRDRYGNLRWQNQMSVTANAPEATIGPVLYDTNQPNGYDEYVLMYRFNLTKAAQVIKFYAPYFYNLTTIPAKAVPSSVAVTYVGLPALSYTLVTTGSCDLEYQTDAGVWTKSETFAAGSRVVFLGSGTFRLTPTGGSKFLLQ